MIRTAITEMFGVDYPTICGSLMRLCTPELCAASSEAGGLGNLTCGNYETEEELRAAIPRILARNLHALTCAEIEVDAWKRPGRVDHLLTAVVNRLDGTLGGDAVLEVKWTLADERMKKMVMTRTSTFTETVGTRDYRALATAYSRLIAAFGREVAGALASLSPERGGTGN